MPKTMPTRRFIEMKIRKHAVKFLEASSNPGSSTRRRLESSSRYRFPRKSPHRHLVLCVVFEVARVVSLAQLARRVAKDAVHHTPALYHPPVRGRIRPSPHVLVLGHLQKLAGTVKQALGELAVPGPDSDVGDGVL